MLVFFALIGVSALSRAQAISALSSVTCASSVASPGTAACSVNMTGPAPTGGLGIHMSSNNALVTVPTWVVVSAGASNAAFSATVGSGATGTATITGTFNNVSKSALFTIGSTALPVALSSLTCASSSVTAPGTASCNVNLNRAAPTGGVGVQLSSNNASVSVPGSVTVPAGSSSAPFSAAVASGATGTVTLTGTFNGTSKAVQLQISASSSTVSVSINPSRVTVTAGLAQQFTASVSGTSNTAVTWTVVGTGCSGSSCGTVSSTGLYTAPASVPSSSSVTVKATSQQDSSKSATASAVIGARYYIAPASVGGNDRNDGRSANAPWLTPNHALNCGDLILASPGAYDAQNFTINNWGTVSCPSGNNVVWLKCATFDTCRISTSSMSSGMWIDRSYWGVQGWEITTQKGGMEPACFLVAPNFNTPTEVHHVIFANNVANGCQGGGFQSVNHFGQLIGVDYLAVVGNIAYKTTQGSSECFTGISVYFPVASDSLAGTHVYLAGNFSWNNFDPDYCAGGPATDGEGLMFDELDASNQGLRPYAGQVVADNNILFANGGAGLQIDRNNVGTGPWATVYTRHNTLWGNNHDTTLTGWGQSELLLGEVNNTHSTYDLAVTNLSSNGGHQVYGFYVLDCPTTTNTISKGWAYSPYGTSAGAIVSPGFSYDSSNIVGIDPQLTSPTIPGSPNCSGSQNVTACMSSVIANFTPRNSAAKAYGYQIPGSTLVVDSLFPQWLCSVNNFPAGVVTLGCAK
jgi:hypothetical protein